jgi:hypothetical protein
VVGDGITHVRSVTPATKKSETTSESELSDDKRVFTFDGAAL